MSIMYRKILSCEEKHMNKCINRFVEYQVEKKRIEESEVEVYQYGYRLLIEKILAFLLTIVIAFVFKAWIEVLLFCAFFIPLRTYAGGYHAKTTIGCMVLSGGIITLNIFVKRIVMATGFGMYVLLLELLLFPLVVGMAPVETSNRTISESEKRHFKKVVFGVYMVQILVCVIFACVGKVEWIGSVVLAHVSVVGGLLVGRKVNGKLEKGEVE